MSDAKQALPEEIHARKQENMREFLEDIRPEADIVLGILARKIADWNTHQGFWPEDVAFRESAEFKGSRFMLMVTELAEGYESVRKPGPDQHCPDYPGEWVELADTLIRILDYVGKYQIPLAAVMEAKLRVNLSRPYKHGKKC